MVLDWRYIVVAFFCIRLTYGWFIPNQSINNRNNGLVRFGSSKSRSERVAWYFRSDGSAKQYLLNKYRPWWLSFGSIISGNISDESLSREAIRRKIDSSLFPSRDSLIVEMNRRAEVYSLGDENFTKAKKIENKDFLPSCYPENYSSRNNVL